MTIHDMTFRPASPSCSADCPHCAQAWRSALGRLVKANRRRRKAKKNLVMYKLAGRRPWDCVQCIASGTPISEHDALYWSLGSKDEDAPMFIHMRLKQLRERSGFLEMSRRAHEMALTKAHERAYTDEAVSYTSERFKELLAAFTLDINAAASAGLSIYDDTEPRTAGCRCQWEAGDSPCRVHGENEEATL